MNPYEIIGKNLAAVRDKLGLSQDESASYLGVSRPTISNYETAEKEIPLPHLERLADLYCVNIADLMSDSPFDRQATVAFAFKSDGLTTNDLQHVANFQKVVKNYLKMKSVLNGEGKGD